MGDSLLPSDCLVVELGLLLDNPIAKSRAGKRRVRRSKEVLSAAEKFQEPELFSMKQLAVKAVTHMEYEVSLSAEAGKPVREDPPPALTPNLSVIEIVNHLLLQLEAGLILTKTGEERAENAAVSSISSLVMRGVKGAKPISPVNHKAYPSLVLAAQIDVIIQELSLQFSRAQAYHNQTINAHKKGETKPPWKPKIDSPSLKHNTNVVVIGPLVMVDLSLRKWVLTTNHFFRILHMLKGISNLLVAMPTLSLKQTPLETILTLLETILDTMSEDIEYTGEYLKAARQLLISTLASDNLMGEDPEKLLAAAFDRPKAQAAKLFKATLKRLTRTTEDAINLSNIFKILPHPDTNLYKCFQTIQGLTDPNKLKPGVIRRFKGTLRRSLFMSLSGMKKQVRLRETAPEGEALAAASNKTQVSLTNMQSASHTQWSAVEFQRVQEIPTAESIIVPPTDKSSQMQFNGDFTDIESVTEWAATGGVNEPQAKSELGTVNDAISSLKGESRLEAKRAIPRFEKVKRLHEGFEAKYLERGMDIDDIPEEELADFVKSTPGARYMVGTEPKFGEKQKKVTRMFYIPEQELKAITQRVERLGKYVSRKQFGVSIVKSYPARQRDVENFAVSMNPQGAEDENGLNVFVSFDMSEFSKKFPMALVRAYGEVLAEITGEAWLSRIDLIFRACIVLHNSRGFFDHLEGVKGGFEGFLNFVWSSIHAIIMEIALESNGLVGNLLCFSDDGLLSFHVPAGRDNDYIRNKVLGIQQVYKDYGLIFHLGKTLVSSTVWEYLGDVCYRSKLLPMWVKEVASFNNLQRTKGLDPFYSKIRSIEGQARALTKAGLGYDLAYLLLRMTCHFRLQQVSATLKPQVEELLLMTPTSAGGLRIASPAELAISCTISTDAEVIADYEAFLRVDSSYAAPLRNHIISGSKPPKKPVRAIISGTRLRVKTADMSGMNVVNEAIEMIKENSVSHKTLATDPLRGVVADALDNLLRHAINIEIEPIIDLLFSMPDWVAYTKSMALAKSSSALRLVPRSALRRLQAKDTRNIQTGILKFQEAMAVGARAKFEPYDLVTQAGRRIFPNYNLAAIKRSPRSTLNLTDELPMVLVAVDSPGWQSISSAEYVEPHVRFPQDVSSLSWYSEATGDLNVRSARRMLNSIARFLTYSPDAQDFVIQMAILAGIAIPEVAPGMLYGAHRYRLRNGANPDFRVMLPKPYQRFTRARLVGGAAQLVFNADRADRTTITEYARVLAYQVWAGKVNLGRCERASVEMIQFQYISPDPATDILTNIITIQPGFRLIREIAPLPPELHNEYINSVIENREYARYSEAIETASLTMEALDDHERDIVREISIVNLKRWMIKLSSAPVVGLCPLFAAPVPMILRPYITMMAAIQAVWTMIAPRIRREVMDLVNGLTGGGEGANLLVNDEPVVRVLNNDSFMTFIDHLARLTDSLAAASSDYLPTSSLTTILHQPAILIRHLHDIILTHNFMPGGQIVAVRSASSLPGAFTESHRVAFKAAATATISTLLARLSAGHWNEQRVRNELNIPMNLDDLLDMLYITRLLFRASEHRNVHHPYNSKSAAIMALKFYRAILDARDNLPGGSNDHQIRRHLEDFRLNRWDRGTLNRALMGGRGNLGPDHTAQLGEPLPPELISRATFHVRTELTRHNRFKGTILTQGNQRLLERVQALYHQFYQTIIARTVAGMMEIPGQLEKTIIDKFSPSTPAQANMMMLETNIAHIQSRFIDIDDLDPHALSELVYLVKELALDFLQRTYSPGFRIAGRQSRLTEAALGELYHREGTIVADLDDRGEAEAQVVLLRYNTPQKALSAYANLQSPLGSSLCIFRDRDTRLYLVAGLTTAKPAIIEEENNPLVRTGLNAQLDDLIPELSVLGQARMVVVSRKVAEGEDQGLAPFDVSSQIVTTYVRNVVGGSYLNQNSAYLQVASNLARPASTPIDRMIAYALLIMHFRGLQRDDMLAALVRRLAADLNGNNEQLIMDLTHDIGLALSWLWSWRITEGTELDPQEVAALVRRVPRVRLVRRLPEMATRAVPVHPDQVVNRAAEHGIDITRGNLAQSLFQNPMLVPAIEAEAIAEEDGGAAEADEALLDLMGL